MKSLNIFLFGTEYNKLFKCLQLWVINRLDNDDFFSGRNTSRWKFYVEALNKLWVAQTWCLPENNRIKFDFKKKAKNKFFSFFFKLMKICCFSSLYVWDLRRFTFLFAFCLIKQIKQKSQLYTLSHFYFCRTVFFSPVIE